MSSNHLGLVRFPDGEVMVGNYSGTADVFAQDLITAEQWAAMAYEVPPGTYNHATGGDLVEVECWTMYGGGFSWPARATADRQAIVNEYQLGDLVTYGPITDGTPRWAAVFLAGNDPEWLEGLDG